LATFTPSGFTVDAFICDSATAVNGKLYLLGGGWNVLTCPTLPFTQPRIGVAIIVAVPYTATNMNNLLELRLETEDGDRVPVGPASADAEGGTTTPMGVRANFNLGRPAALQPGDAQNLPFAVNLDHIVFTAPGAYSFVITINDEDLERLTFRVIGRSG
jgi:hypothetical protein